MSICGTYTYVDVFNHENFQHDDFVNLGVDSVGGNIFLSLVYISE